MVRLTITVDAPPPTLWLAFRGFFGMCLTFMNMILCVIQPILHMKKKVFNQRQESQIPPYLPCCCSVTKWSDSGTAET